MGRIIDIDLEAVRVAYMVRDATKFEQLLAPLGVDLSLAAVEAYLARWPTSRVSLISILVSTIVQCLASDTGIALRKAELDHYIGLAVTKESTLVVGISTPTHGLRYGWPEIPRWHGDVSMNRHAVATWIAAPERATDALTLAIRARPASTRERTEADLLAAILADPDDDAARLVYADHLMEMGDPRGDLIRLQCQLATTLEPRDGPIRTAALRAYDRCRAVLAADVAGAEISVYRGFIDRIELTVAALAKLREKLFALHPVRTLVVAVPHHAAALKLAGLVAKLPACVTRIEIDGTDRGSEIFLDDDNLAPLWERGGELALRNVIATGPQWAAALAAISHRAVRIDGDLPEVVFHELADPKTCVNAVDLAFHQRQYTSRPDLVLPMLRRIGARPGLAAVELTWGPNLDNQEMATAALFDKASIAQFGSRNLGAVSGLLRSPAAKSLRRLDMPLTRDQLEEVANCTHLYDLVEIGLALRDDAMPWQIAKTAETLARWSSIERVFLHDGRVPKELAKTARNVEFLGRAKIGTPYLADPY